MPKFLISILTAALLLHSAFAGPPKEATKKVRIATIKLNDGTSVRGHVKGLKDGYYLIETLSLGELRVSAQRITGISYEPPASAEPKTAGKPKPTAVRPVTPADMPAVDNQQMQNMMQQMLGSPEIMQLVEQLSQDPSIQKMVEDPELQKAVNAGNYLELLQHPSIRSLMDNPTVQQITAEVKDGPDGKPAAAAKPDKAGKE